MYSIIRILFLVNLGCLTGRGQISVLTANGSNDRTNANLLETQLAPATVTPSTFGKIGSFPVDGQVYSQALYVSALPMAGGGSQNVLFVSTMHNSVYAFNADSMSPVSVLWHVNLGPSVPSATLFGPNGDVAIEVGILSTGAIDLQRRVLYVVSDTLQHGAATFYLHALDLQTGEERLNGPAVITGAVKTASVTGNLQFDAQQHIQRPGLLLANDAVYIAFGSHGDQAPWHGWVMSYDASNLTRQIAVFVDTPSGNGGSIWQSGRGLAADDRGNVYAIAANGDYDGSQNFGQSFLKLAGAALERVASFTPADWKSMSDRDFDLSGGPALIPGAHTLMGADKLGNFYIFNTDSMKLSGSVNSENGESAFSVARFSIFNFALWSRAAGSTYVYVQGEKEGVKCFQLTSSGFDTSPVSMASSTIRFGRIGMTISANGGQRDSGILWETSGNYNDPSAPGTLHAFDASNLANELWNSDMNPGSDGMGAVAKFVSPTVVNGKVYVPTFSKSVVVYGLLGLNGDTQPVIGAVANAASYSQEAVSPGELVAVFGSSLGPATPAGTQVDASGLVSTRLADTRVLFDGVPGPIESTSANQVNAIAPFALSSQSTQVQVEYQGQLSEPFSMTVAPSSPGIFTADGSGGGQGIIWNQDGTLNSADNPASAGSVIVLYATGAGQISPAGKDGGVVTANSLPQPVLPVSAMVGGKAATVLYAGGAFGMVEGIIQVNLQVPDGASQGPAVPVVLQIGDSTSHPGVTLALR